MIQAIVIALIISWMLDYAQYAITKFNYDNNFNGKGCIESVLNGMALAPMQYRVAIPWLYRIFPYYEIIKIFMMAFGLFTMYLMAEIVYGGYGLQTMFITALIYVINFQFDYIEQYLELGIWALFVIGVFTGNLYLLFGCIIAGSLNRETTGFLPLMYLLATGNVMVTWWLIGCLLGVMALLRVIYGIKRSYLDDGVFVGQEVFKGKNHLSKNITEIKKGLRWFLSPIWYAIFMVVLVCAAIVWGIFPKGLHYASFVAIPFIIVLLCRAMFREGVRIMLPLSVFIVPFINGVLRVN